MKTDKVFIDSNIWLYAFVDSGDNKHQKAKMLIQNSESEIIINTQVINEVSFTLLRKKILQESEICELIIDFYTYLVEAIDIGTILLSSDLRRKYQFSFWDSQIVAAALKADCKFLFSEDMHHDLFVENKLKIINPFK